MTPRRIASLVRRLIETASHTKFLTFPDEDRATTSVDKPVERTQRGYASRVQEGVGWHCFVGIYAVDIPKSEEDSALIRMARPIIM